MTTWSFDLRKSGGNMALTLTFACMDLLIKTTRSYDKLDKLTRRHGQAFNKQGHPFGLVSFQAFKLLSF